MYGFIHTSIKILSHCSSNSEPNLPPLSYCIHFEDTFSVLIIKKSKEFEEKLRSVIQGLKASMATTSLHMLVYTMFLPEQLHTYFSNSIRYASQSENQNLGIIFKTFFTYLRLQDKFGSVLRRIATIRFNIIQPNVR